MIHCYINIFRVIYLCIIYFIYTINKWNTVFKYYFLLALFASASASPVFSTVIVPLTSIYALL